MKLILGQQRALQLSQPHHQLLPSLSSGQFFNPQMILNSCMDPVRWTQASNIEKVPRDRYTNVHRRLIWSCFSVLYVAHDNEKETRCQLHRTRIRTTLMTSLEICALEIQVSARLDDQKDSENVGSSESTKSYTQKK